MQFFVDELYGPRDFSQHDVEVARAVPIMITTIPSKGLISWQTALRLNCLSLELDIALVQKLGGDVINRSRYFDCYRQSSKQSQREEQIQLLEISV
jgi:hypothetical protein